MPRDFPHMMPKERLVWAAFLLKYGTQWDRFDYDTHVGEGHEIDPNWPDFIQTMVRKVSPKRIDVVGWKGGLPTIFEVTPRAGGSTWGRLKMYQYLFIQQFPLFPRPALVYVVPRIDRDARRYLEAEGITIYLVESLVPG